jgi:CheY-like chemotaxis protein/two-component sensor histidine kinase
MSHELRTPLNSLLVLARMLAQNPDHNLTPRQVEYANIIHSSGTDLLQLINDILDLAKVEAGKMDIHPERFDLAGLADDLRAVFQPLTAEKRLRFTIETAADAPAEMSTDKQRLRQILYNLLSNAVKFTEQGQVQLRIEGSGRSLPGNGAAVAFSVTDTGIGVSQDNLGTIFAAFHQGDGTTSRRYGGTGLGLAICREVATQLGGEITVQSEPGSGSIFTLRLPVTLPAAGEHASDGPADSGRARPRESEPDPIAGRPDADMAAGHKDVQAVLDAAPSAARISPPAPAAKHESLIGRKILVVDDDPRNALVLADVLELYSMTVVRATDGHKAIDELAAGDIDLVLMDIMMPQLDGYETTRAIRRMPHLAHIPVIAVTARAMQGDREKSIAAGATDYVTKPVDIEELLTRMEQWLALAPTGTRPTN